MPVPSIVAPDPLSARVDVVPVILPLTVMLPVLVTARVSSARVPPLLTVIPAMVVEPTSVIVCPLRIVIVSVVWGVVLLQLVQLPATLKFPEDTLEVQLNAYAEGARIKENIKNKQRKKSDLKRYLLKTVLRIII